jgi:carboxymethylenebutenolidase
VAASLAQLAAEPSIRHLPGMTGATGRQAVERFYAEEFLPHLPGDLVLTRMSRTVDRFRLVDEMTVSFTHDQELPWLLPGVGPTHRRAEVLAVAIVGFERGRIRSQRFHWDHTTLTRQLGIPGTVAAG